MYVVQLLTTPVLPKEKDFIGNLKPTKMTFSRMRTFVKDFHDMLCCGKGHVDMVVPYTTEVRQTKKTKEYRLYYKESHYNGVHLQIDPLFFTDGVLRRVQFMNNRIGPPACAVCLKWFQVSSK